MRIVGVQAGKSGYTIADGIFVKEPGELTMSVLDDVLDDLVHTSATRRSAKRSCCSSSGRSCSLKAPEPSVLAALLHGRVGGAGPVAVVLSGGNIDPTLLISIMRHGLTVSGRYLVIRTRVPDRPGELIKLLELLAEQRANVVSVNTIAKVWRSPSATRRSS